jgi:hypothetical protein
MARVSHSSGWLLGISHGANVAVLALCWGVGTHPLFSIPVEHGATSEPASKACKWFKNWRIIREDFGDRRFGVGLRVGAGSAAVMQRAPDIERIVSRVP